LSVQTVSSSEKLYKHKTQPEIAFEKTQTFLNRMLRSTTRKWYPYQYGLVHFQKYIAAKHPTWNIETIIQPLLLGNINVYELLDGFVSYLMEKYPDFTPGTLKHYMTGVRSYLAFYDIDVIPSKFKRKVKMPRTYREDELPLDAQDIRKILLACNNRRLKPYLLVLASGGMRATEGLAIRLMDVDFSVLPTKVHIRREYAKTKVPRDIYISDEATQYLKQWIDWKYQDRKIKGRTIKRKTVAQDLVFTVYSANDPNSLYVRVLGEFEKLLTVAGMDQRKDSGVQRRRKITLHSMRRFVKTVVSDQVNQDYSEWFIGHNKSPYYTKKEPERRELYSKKCMKYLTFLDYTTLENTGRNIETKLALKDSEIEELRQEMAEMQKSQVHHSEEWESIRRDMAEMKKNIRFT
jgi:hypothetical protein